MEILFGIGAFWKTRGALIADEAEVEKNAKSEKCETQNS